MTLRLTAFALALALFAAPLAAQRVTGISVGTDTATASLLLSLQPTQTLSQSFKVVVIVFGPAVALQVWRGVKIVNGVRVGIPFDTVTVGETGCLYATATDRFGNQIPGLGPVNYTSSNPAVLSVGTSALCPLTTVRFADIPIPPPVLAPSVPSTPPNDAMSLAAAQVTHNRLRRP